MARRKITQEADHHVQQHDQPAAQAGSKSDSGRKQLTQRMPPELVDDVDAFAAAHGMSRNAAINFLVREGLRSR